MGLLCTCASLALTVWIVVTFMAGVMFLMGGVSLVGIGMLLCAIVATPPACYAAALAGELFSGKVARRRC